MMRSQLLFLALLACMPVAANSQSLAQCARRAAATHQVPAEVIALIWRVEWGTVGACSAPNDNGSVDCGPLQINSIHFADLETQGIQAVAVRDDPCTNFDIAARQLRSHFEVTRSWYAAMGRYHSKTPAVAARYLRRIDAAMAELRTRRAAR